MNLKQPGSIFLVCLSIFANFAATAAPIADDTPSAPATVTDISSRKYFPAALAAIDGAKKSVYACLYYIGYYGKEGAVKELMDALVRARDGGADVCVILDGNALPESVEHSKSMQAFAYLYGRGIPVFYDETGTTTHSKLIIIDGTDVILGSTNWSAASMLTNREASVLIRSPELARQYTDEFLRIPKNSPQPSREGFPIPEAFFSRKIGARLVTKKSKSGLDLYLYACKKAAEGQGSTVTITADELLKYVLYDLAPRYYPRVLTLSKVTVGSLIKKHGIITAVNIDHRGNTLSITAPSLEGGAGEGVRLSDKYFEYSWHTRLTSAAKFAYLVLLNETRNGALGRMLSFTSINTLAKKYGVGPLRFIYGFSELQRWNLIERYVNLDMFHPKANDYAFNDLYSMDDFRVKFDALKARTPPEAFDVAYKAAVELDEPYDLDVIGKFIDACDQYGIERFQAVARNITAQSRLSSYRTASFLLTKLRKGLKD